MFGCVAGNEIDDEGVKALAKALEQDSTVTSIDLSGKCGILHLFTDGFGDG